MESQTSKKRPWDDDSSDQSRFKRRDSTFAAPAASPTRQTSPLPHEAGYYSHDSRILSQRKLPPLYTSSCISPVGPATSISVQDSTHAQQPPLLDHPRPRSQSLFNVFQHPHWQDHELHTERPIDHRRTLDLDASPPPLRTEVHRPRLGTGPAPHAAGASICCPSACEGQECSSARALMRTLATQLTLLNNKVNTITQTEPHSPEQFPRLEHSTLKETLELVLNVVHRSNASLQEHLERQPSRSLTRLSQPDEPASMRRGQHHLEEREEQSPPARHHPAVHHGYPGYAQPSMILEDPRRLPFHSGDMASIGNSPHNAASSPGSAFMPPQSPMQTHQPARSTILPSPSSLNFPSGTTLPSISSSPAAAQTSAQSAHLQDLQHQISVKSLAFQTLQSEYDSLLQKLERQRTKCATLEKKFEVSDIEINSLTDEKEKLYAQIAALENQVEDLQQSRDEARHQLVANGAQYMRIMEMANRLQGQGAEDKKKWEAERAELEQRIRLLEEAMVTGTEEKPSETDNPASASPAASSAVPSHKSTTPSASQSETINVLRAEVGRLRSRTQVLETALQTMRRESISIQAAARQLVESGGRLEEVAQVASPGGG